MSVKRLLETAKSLPEIKQRKIAAVLGACVGDAAARPLHWVYDVEALDSYLKEDLSAVDRVGRPEFLPESRSPFYDIPTGENSCYFDIAACVLKTLSKSGYDYDKIARDIENTFFGPGTEYSVEKKNAYSPPDPIQGKWISGSLVRFSENYRQGKKPYGDGYVKESDGFCAALPVVLLFSGEPDVMTKAEELVRTLTAWPAATSWGMVAASIVDKFVQGKDDPIGEAAAEAVDKYPDVAEDMSVVDWNLGNDHITAVGTFGRSCANPGSPMGALHAFRTSKEFKEAVRKTIRAGGCNCSRSFFIGAMFGAKYGIDGIPRDWVGKARRSEEVLELAIKAFNK